MLAVSFRTQTRRSMLAIAALLPFLAACPDHNADKPATTPPPAQAQANIPPAPVDPTNPSYPSGANNPRAPEEKPGPVTDKMPMGTPPKTEVITAADGVTQTIRQYYPNGKLYCEFQQKPGPDGKYIRHGPIKAWHDNGIMQQDGAYTDGKISGHWRYWDDMAQLEREGDFDQGLREGDWKELYPGEKMRSAGFFHVGLAEGPWKLWHDNGQLMAEGSFENNKREGVWKYYLKTGELDVDRTGTYKDNHKVQ